MKLSKPKYIFVTGGVASSLGKGIISASIARLLQARGYSVTIQKLDPYINVDPGTLNPYEHGDDAVDSKARSERCCRTGRNIVLSLMETRQEQPRPKFSFDRGDDVRVIAGGGPSGSALAKLDDFFRRNHNFMDESAVLTVADHFPDCGFHPDGAAMHTEAATAGNGASQGAASIPAEAEKAPSAAGGSEPGRAPGKAPWRPRRPVQRRWWINAGQ